MTFEKDYKNLIEFAEKLIQKHSVRLSAGDLVNEAYIIFSTNKQPYDSQKFRATMGSILFDEKSHSNTHVQLGAVQYKQDITEERVCRQCKTPKPVGSFPRLKYNFSDNICDECLSVYQQKYQAKYYQKNKNNPHLKRLKAQACRIYRANPQNKAAQKQRVKDYFNRQREQLGDYYIKHLLATRKKNPLKGSQVTPEIIEQKRREILASRVANDFGKCAEPVHRV
jgi:hypothetical protein